MTDSTDSFTEMRHLIGSLKNTSRKGSWFERVILAAHKELGFRYLNRFGTWSSRLNRCVDTGIDLAGEHDQWGYCKLQCRFGKVSAYRGPVQNLKAVERLLEDAGGSTAVLVCCTGAAPEAEAFMRLHDMRLLDGDALSRFPVDWWSLAQSVEANWESKSLFPGKKGDVLRCA